MVRKNSKNRWDFLDLRDPMECQSLFSAMDIIAEADEMEFPANEKDSRFSWFGKTWSAQRRSEYLVALKRSASCGLQFPSPTANTLDWVLLFPTHHP